MKFNSTYKRLTEGLMLLKPKFLLQNFANLEQQEYKLNDDGTVDLYDDFQTPIQFFLNGKLLVKFNETRSFTLGDNTEKELRTKNSSLVTTFEGCPNKVKGTFKCVNEGITNCEFFPKEIIGPIYCYGNKLTSLKGLPEKVGSLSLFDNNITTLKDGPKIVNGGFWVRSNKLTNLIGCPEFDFITIKASQCPVVDFSFNQLTTLEGCTPTIVNCEKFLISDNNLTNLKHFPQIKNSDLCIISCSNNNLTTLEGCPEEINCKEFIISNNSLLTSFVGCPKVVKAIFNCNNLNGIKSLDGFPKEIYGMVILPYSVMKFFTKIGDKLEAEKNLRKICKIDGLVYFN